MNENENIEYIENEIKKCKDSPYYFYTTYFTVDGKPATTRHSEEDFNNFFPKENSLGDKIIPALQVGMKIRHQTNEGWCKKGQEVSVEWFDFEKNNVYTSDKQNWSIAGFLENIDTGKFKVTYYPIPLPNPNTEYVPSDKEMILIKERRITELEESNERFMKHIDVLSAKLEKYDRQYQKEEEDVKYWKNEWTASCLNLVKWIDKYSDLEKDQKETHNEAISLSIDVIQDMIARLKEWNPKDNIQSVQLLDAAITLLINLKK